MSVVPEDSALIAIVDWDGRAFAVKNNTEKTIVITRIELGSGLDIAEIQVPSVIEPGGLSQITLIGDAEELSGREIQLVADWKGGSAEIISTIPEFVEDEVEIVPVLEIEETDSVTENIETNSVSDDIKTDTAPENITTDPVLEDITTDTAPEHITTDPVPEEKADPVAEETTDSDTETETDLESDEQ